MVGTTAAPDAEITNGDDAFLSPASIRQTADGLGPRAHRTIARIIEAARGVFMTRGYAGTTIDEIARVAKVSRASFYTYFASKREVLLAVGAHTASASAEIIETLADRPKTIDGMIGFVSDYFELLDLHGSFAFAWTQAAQEDEGIRVAGMERHLELCESFGARLTDTSGRPVDDVAVLGVAVASLLERTWSYSQLYAGRIDRTTVIHELATSLFAIATATETAAATG